uniref:Cupin-like domain-containing protein n=2 Tax=Neobodo designis TaxID=312471 RepID=A0A7S1PMI0_NEODS|mmetsp:Transcript_12641/g.39328  ORF Transcript_12641/g.39328 Transcript_12641/m.39328 type:complete len:689 (+) Transcript_12641:71-2137(+)
MTTVPNTARSLAELFVTCAALVALVATVNVHAADPVTSGTITVENPTVARLHKCRETQNETLALVRCHEEAVLAIPQNYSWWSSLALLYTRADMNEQAQEAMNKSVAVWIDAMQPHFLQGGLNITDGKTRWVEALRHAYDDETRDKEVRQAEAVEMGFLLAKKFEMEHHPTDAHSIYYEFLLQTGTGQSQVVDFHRRTGNILGMILTGPQNDTSALWRIGESLAPVLDGISEHLGTKGDGPFAEPIKRMCGIEFDDNRDVKVADLVDHIETCIERWGNLTLDIDEQPEHNLDHYANVMKETPLHKLAQVGATRTIRTVLEHLRGRTFPYDRFGRGALHHAAAWGRDETVKMLVDQGGDVDLEDKGTVSARTLGCSSPGAREAFETAAKAAGVPPPVCMEKNIREKLIDEDAEITDDTGIDGGWNPRFKRPKYLHCDFDVKDASKLTQSELMIMHTTANHPVVLRNSFYEDDGPNSKFLLKKFNKTFGGMYVRQEKFPRGSRWGLGRPEVVTLTDYLRTLKQDDGKVASVNVDHVRHPLTELVDKWQPPTFSNKKKPNELSFYDAETTVATVTINKKGSKAHHHLRAQGFYHTVVYGHQEWKLLPPRHARTQRGPLSSDMDPFALRCELVTGDVLLVPDLWSASWESKANGISFERFVYKTDTTGLTHAQAQARRQRRRAEREDSTEEL